MSEVARAQVKEFGTDLVRYDAMCRAIDAAYAVDEVKAIHDRAVALERYQQLAKNVEAEDRCYQIRWRAANKAGELLKAMEKAKGNQYKNARSPEPTEHKTLSELGISKQQSSDWQKLAAVPKDEFEAALATKSVRDLIDKPAPVSDLYLLAAPSTPEEERKQQRWAATSNLIDGILLFDRHKPGDGFEPHFATFGARAPLGSVRIFATCFS